MYFKARFYDPDTGRFLSEDAYLGEIGTPPSLHRYLYAYANPLLYLDLTGYQSTTAEGALATQREVNGTTTYGTPVFAEQEKLREEARSADRPEAREGDYSLVFYMELLQRLEGLAETRAGLYQDRIVKESTGEVGTDDAEDLRRERARVAQQTKLIAQMLYGSADFASGIVNAPKGLHDLHEAIQTLPEDTLTRLWQTIKENPGKTAAATALPYACVKKCPRAVEYLRGLRGTVDEVPQVGRAELDALRAKYRLSADSDTIAVGRTNIPGLEKHTLEGLSPTLRREAGLPSLDEARPLREVRSPFVNQQFTRHAEEDLLAGVEQSIKRLGLDASALEGRVLRIHISNPLGVYNKCAVGLLSQGAKAGVIRKFSELYPTLRIEISAQGGAALKGHEVLIVQGGRIVK